MVKPTDTVYPGHFGPYRDQRGVDLRTWIATQALAGIRANTLALPPNTAAEFAVRDAAALIAELNKQD